MAVGVKINLNGLSELNIKLEGIENRAMNVSAPLKRGGTLMLYSIQKNFDSGGRPNHWTPLAASTLKQKSKQGYSSQPLIKKGNLRSSIVYRAYSNRLVIGTKIKYAAIHQFGGVINQGARSELFQRNRYLRGSRAGSFKRGVKLIGARRVGFGFGDRGFTRGATTINIPARPFLVFQDKDIENINKEVKDYIMGIR